jgi:hypothetical protein
MGEYIPSAPVDEEAKKRNGNLPGMCGVYNLTHLIIVSPHIWECCHTMNNQKQLPMLPI